jgi:uncharacterized membrane protein
MKVLFLGEGLPGSGNYLAAILRWSGMEFKHCPDLAQISPALLRQRYEAVILSDYRYSNWTRSGVRWLESAVQQGMGLMMIGGYASFTGLVGHYAGTAIEKLLPVRCVPGDDRVNRPAVLQGGRWPSVVVNGYHRCRPKPGSQTVLGFRDLMFKAQNPVLAGNHPALVLGQSGSGRTAAFLTDCAPHWAGGLVDWGAKRVRVRVGQDTVELGETYLRFFSEQIRRLSKA